MNSLSWLLYLADIIPGIGVFLKATAFVSIILLIVGMGVCAGMAADGDLPPGSWKYPAKFLWVPITMLFVAAFAPSTQTIYMIAASEMGEEVVQSPEVADTMRRVKALIDKKLSDMEAPE